MPVALLTMLHAGRRSILSLAGLLLLGTSAGAQAATRDSIDVHLDQCLAVESNQTTAGMAQCTGDAIRAWDRRMNAVYQAAMAALDPASRKLLRTSQRQWLAFRTAERAAQQAPWTADRGTIIRLEILGATLDAVRTRTGELQVYVP